MHGNLGIGCISDFEPQPLLIQSHLGKLCHYDSWKDPNNTEELEQIYRDDILISKSESTGQIQCDGAGTL